MSRTQGNLGLIGAWGAGYDGWGVDMDRNLLVMSALSNMVALSATTFLPTAAAGNQGAVYIVPHNAGANPDTVAVCDNASWVYLTPQIGWTCFVSDAGRHMRFMGATLGWVSLGIISDLDGAPSNRNALINGAFDVAQRGSSGNAGSATTGAAGTFAADRWLVYLAAGTPAYNLYGYAGGSDLPEGVKQYLSMATTTASAAYNIVQRIENSRRFNGRNMVVSAYVRAGAGSCTIVPSIKQFFGTTGSPSAAVVTATTSPVVTPTGAFIRYQWKFAVPDTSGKTISTDNTDYLEVNFLVTCGAAAANIHFACAQAEQGLFASAFEVTPLQATLSKCQRYFTTLTGLILNNYAAAAVNIYGSYPCPTTMRAAPTETFANVTYSNMSALASNGPTLHQCRVTATMTAAGAGYVVFDVLGNAEL